jgi:hypothetical protein
MLCLAAASIGYWCRVIMVIHAVALIVIIRVNTYKRK